MQVRSRAHIRAALATIIERSTGVKSFAKRVVDGRDLSACFRVYLARGDVSSLGESDQTDAVLVVSYTDFATEEDDRLDDVMAVAQRAIDADITLGGLVFGVELVGFEYPDTEPGAGLELQHFYSVTYR